MLSNKEGNRCLSLRESSGRKSVELANFLQKKGLYVLVNKVPKNKKLAQRTNLLKTIPKVGNTRIFI